MLYFIGHGFSDATFTGFHHLKSVEWNEIVAVVPSGIDGNTFEFSFNDGTTANSIQYSQSKTATVTRIYPTEGQWHKVNVKVV